MYPFVDTLYYILKNSPIYFKYKPYLKLLFLSLEATILLILFSIFSFIRFLVKIFGGIIMELLVISGLIKKTYKNVPKEIIEF